MPIPRISKEDLKARLDAAETTTPPVIIDVRLKYPYEHSTVELPGAVRIDPDHVDSGKIPSGRDVVAYDSDPDEIVSARVTATLIAAGRTAFALKGGIAEWMGASLPTQTKEARRQAPPTPGALKG